MSLRVTILGCGSSSGVPRPALGWGACDPLNPKNRRRRCSILVEQSGANGKTRILVDTSPDLREQMLSTDADWLDAVFITHEHADHTHGVDDLRSFFLHQKRRLDIYLDEPTAKVMFHRFNYCFVTQPGSDYPPIANERRIVPGHAVTIHGAGGSISVMPFLQEHGDIASLGYRFGGLAYSSDVNALPDESLTTLNGLDVWIIDALRYRPHPSHFSVDDALGWIKKLAPRRAILTNMHSDLDYEELRARLPENVEPAYDGMQIELG
ncbi:MAG: MBL fold metallo-hydrolase [Xanthobacteraceae bacterium]